MLLESSLMLNAIHLIHEQTNKAHRQNWRWALFYALFMLFQAFTQSLAGGLDSSLGGCQNYRALGFTIIRHLKIFS